MKNWSVLVQNGVKNGALMVLKGSKMVHSGSEKLPKWVPGRSRDLAGRLRGAKMAYRASKDRKRRPNGPPKGSHKGPKRVPKVDKKLIKKHVETGVDFEVDFGSILIPFGVPNRTNLVTKMVFQKKKRCKQQISK